MSEKKVFEAKRLGSLLAVFALAALSWAAWKVSGADDTRPLPKLFFYNTALPQDGDSAWSGMIVFGGSGADGEGTAGISGLSAGRAAEYRSADSSPLFGLRLFYDGGSDYWRIGALYLGSDEIAAQLSGSAGRLLLTSTTLTRFQHRLDNDLAADWSGSVLTVEPGSAGVATEMTVTDLRSLNRIKLRGVTIDAHLRLLMRNGDRQARTMDHCTSCHVTTAGQGLEQRAVELGAGGELVQPGVVLRYHHVYRKFNDSSSALSHNYINRFGNFDLEGAAPYAAVPDNTHNSYTGAARVDLGNSVSAIGLARYSSTTNDATRYSAESSRISGILTLRPGPWATFRGRYDRIESDSDVPMASNRELDRFGGTLVFRPARALRLEGSYRWERIERGGGTELERTTTKSYRFKGTLRPGRRLRATFAWRRAEVTDPLGRVLRNSFSRVEGTFLGALGTEEDELEAMLTYSPVPGSSLVFGYRWNKSENPSVNMEAETRQLTAGGHFSAGGLVLHARVFRYDNNVDRDAYLGVLAPMLEIVTVPYDGTGTTAEIGATLPLGSAVRISPSYLFTRVESVFDDSNLGAGVNSAVDVDATIQRLTLRGDLRLMEHLGLVLVYALDDYADNNLPFSDGRVQWFRAGLLYRF